MTQSAAVSVVISCEHGGNQIPPEYARLFADAADVLQTHRGWDPGALCLARDLASRQNARLFFSETSRLLIELNRSQGHRSLFSEFSLLLPDTERQRLIDHYYLPWRETLRAAIAQQLQQHGTVIHLSIHSFTPIWQDQVRRTDIGLLYDPRRRAERALCDAWKRNLKQADPSLTVHSNQPYRGMADGFTTYLRKQFPAPTGVGSETPAQPIHGYLGIEVEVNQRLIADATTDEVQRFGALFSATLPISLLASPISGMRQSGRRN